MSLRLFVHAHPGVSHREQNIVARHHGRMLAGDFGIKANAARLNGQFAATGHGVARVDGQIQDDLFDLALIRFHRPERRIERRLQFDILAEKARQHFRHILNNCIEIQYLSFQHLLPAECQKLTG